MSINENPFGNPMDEEDVFEIDVEQQEAEGRVPEGTYTGKCIGIEKKNSKAGNPMWVWHFVIIEGMYAGKDYKLFTAITPAAIWKLNETLEAFGFGKQVKFRKSDIMNTMVEMVIIHGEFQGSIRDSLDRVLPYHGGAGTKHTGNTVPVPGM